MDRDRLLGIGKLQKGMWKTILDHVLHALVGAAVGGGLLAVWAIGPYAIAAAGAAGTAREAYQWIRSGSPHLLDRLADIAAFTVGGSLAWVGSLFF